jgi:hypothetical protein
VGYDVAHPNDAAVPGVGLVWEDRAVRHLPRRVAVMVLRYSTA